MESYTTEQINNLKSLFNSKIGIRMFTMIMESYNIIKNEQFNDKNRMVFEHYNNYISTAKIINSRLKFDFFNTDKLGNMEIETDKLEQLLTYIN